MHASHITTDAETWVGLGLVDGEHRRLGTIEAVYLDRGSGRPLWMVVRIGRFATRRCFLPLAGAAPSDDVIVTPYDRRQVASAPKVDVDDQLPDEQVRELYRHYALPYGGGAFESAPPGAGETPAERVKRYLA